MSAGRWPALEPLGGIQRESQAEMSSGETVDEDALRIEIVTHGMESRHHIPVVVGEKLVGTAEQNLPPVQAGITLFEGETLDLEEEPPGIM